MEIVAIDDDPILLHTVQMVLEDSFGEIRTLEHPEKLTSLPDTFEPKVIILDLNFVIGESTGGEGLAWIKKIKERIPTVAIVVLTAHGFLELAVTALKQGAFDFLEKPFSNEKLVATVQAGLNFANSQLQLSASISKSEVLINHINQFNNMVIGSSAAMLRVMEVVDKVANTDASILITGEHGTGKEVLAQFIHQRSNRAAQPFVTSDLSAISAGLFESTLFGHIKGAFTDASEDKTGLMETANLGTLLLDEISDISLSLQSKLLAVLENREVIRVGEHRPRALDIRLVASSSKTIEQLSDTKQFRQDLLFRINTVHIDLPPLRHRREDIKPLIKYYLKEFNRKYSRSYRLDKSLLADFIEYEWPGNVRELRNTIERMVITDGSTDFLKSKPRTNEDNLYQLEKNKIEEVIERHAGNISRAAAELGIGRNTLYRKMKRYDL